MAPPFQKATAEEVSTLSDENIVYPIIALTIVILGLLGCVLFVLYAFWFQSAHFGSPYFFDKDYSDVKTANRKKLLLMRRRVSLKALNLNNKRHFVSP